MTRQLYPGSRHPITVRRPEFRFSASLSKHWAAENPLMTHGINGLQLLFPEGERFFIKAVRDHLPHIEDPALEEQARAFSAQEAIHGREHEAFNEALVAQGYRLRPFQDHFERHIAFMNRWAPAWLRLAITAGAEHYTALIGTLLLTEPSMRQGLDPEVERLMTWHAYEEVEHKAVAFDVLQAAGIGHFRRIVGYLLVSLSLSIWTCLGAAMLLRQDGLGLRQLDACRRQLPYDRHLGRRFLAGILGYFRRDFHPNDEDVMEVAGEQLRALGMDPHAA